VKPPKAGSRKAEVYAVFIKSGLDAAIEKAVSLELKANTVKAWASSWGHKGPKGERTPKNGGTEAPARAPKAAHDRQHIHFDIPTRERAIVVLQGIMRRAGTAQAAYQVRGRPRTPRP